MKFKQSQTIAGSGTGERHEYKETCHIKHGNALYKVQFWEGIGKAKNQYNQVGKVEIRKKEGYKTQIEIQACHYSGCVITFDIRRISAKTYQSQIDEALLLIATAKPAEEATRYFKENKWGGRLYYACVESEDKIIVLQEFYLDDDSDSVELNYYHFTYTLNTSKLDCIEEITKKQYINQFEAMQRNAPLLKEKSLLDERLDREFITMHINEKFNVPFNLLKGFISEPDSWKYEQFFLITELLEGTKYGYKTYKIDVRYRDVFLEKLAKMTFRNKAGEHVKLIGDDVIFTT